MSWLTGLTVIYVLIAGFAIAMTLREEQGKSGRSVADRFLGYLACSLWPLTFLAVAYARFTHRPSSLRTD